MRVALFVPLLWACGGDTTSEPPAEDASAPATDGAPAPPQDASADTADTADAAVEPWIEIGTGARAWQPLTDGQEVPIIRGLQGGFHVWGAFRGGGFAGANPTVNFDLHLGERRLAWAEYYEELLPRSADGDIDYAGVSVIYESNDDVEPTSGMTMRLTVRIRDDEGTDLTDETTIVPVCCTDP